MVEPSARAVELAVRVMTVGVLVVVVVVGLEVAVTEMPGWEQAVAVQEVPGLEQVAALLEVPGLKQLKQALVQAPAAIAPFHAIF